VAVDERGLRQAYSAGYAGRRLPDRLAEDSTAAAIYEQGRDDAEAGRPADEHLTSLGTQPKKAPAKAAAKKPANTRPAKRSRRSGQYRKGGFRGRARDLAGHPGTLGTGSGGGLLLAVFIYPIVLAVLQHGPSGATDWLKAKFFNNATPPGTEDVAQPVNGQYPVLDPKTGKTIGHIDPATGQLLPGPVPPNNATPQRHPGTV
jgi:hypothetical protein